MTFRWRAADGPLIAVFGSFLPHQTKGKTLSKLDPLWQLSGSTHGQLINTFTVCKLPHYRLMHAWFIRNIRKRYRTRWDATTFSISSLSYSHTKQAKLFENFDAEGLANYAGSYLIHLFGVRFLLWAGRIPIKYQRTAVQKLFRVHHRPRWCGRSREVTWSNKNGWKVEWKRNFHKH